MTRGMRLVSVCTLPFPCSVPPELADAVIDQLHGDIESLRTCALTCSSWLPTSRYHLFNDVCFEDKDSVLRWTRMFPGPSDIPSYVENLRVSCAPLLDDVSNDALSLSTFIRLKGLFIGGNDIGSEGPLRRNWDCFQRIALFPSERLRTLSLSSPVIPVSTVFSVIHNFPRLDDLHLRCFVASPSGDPEDSMTGASPSFRGMLTFVSHLSYGPFVAGLLTFLGGVHFSCLSFAVLREDELPNLRALVDMCSHTITSLCVTIDVSEWHLSQYISQKSQ